jgi:hypothetical protein
MESDSAYKYSVLKNFVVGYFNSLLGTEKDILPKGILSNEDELFILHGRYIEARSALGNHRFNDSVFVKGNPIDILGHYFDNHDNQDNSGVRNDIYSCFGVEMHRSRYLEVFNKENPQKLDVHSFFANFDWEYKDGVYLPVFKKISPDKIELKEIASTGKLDELKTKDGFFNLSKKILNEDKASKLVDRYF